MVTAVRVSAPTDSLLDPEAAQWRGLSEEPLALTPTPLLAQPSAYVVAAWTERPYGLVKEVRVRAAHNGEALLFRLAWADETRDAGISDADRFPDAAAVLFPLKGDAPLSNMGTKEQPVNAWYWRPDLEQPINVTAAGLGTTVRHPNGSLRAGAQHKSGGWAVVIARPFAVRGDTAVTLSPGQAGKMGFAVWQGSNQERAGIKAVTLDWQPLEIEA